MIGFSKSKSSMIKRQSQLTTPEIVGSSFKSGKESETTPAKRFAVSSLTFDQMDGMYLGNVWVRACIDRIVDKIADTTPLIKPISYDLENNSSKIPDDVKRNMDLTSEMLQNVNESDDSWTDVMKKITRDLLKYDAGAIEVEVMENVGKGKIAELFAVPGNTIKPNVNKKGKFKNNKEAYVQVGNRLNILAKFKPEEMIYLKNNPQSNRIYGLSPLESLVQTVTAELYAAQYNSDFFYNNATPRYAIMMEGMGTGQGNAAIKRFRQWWEQELKGDPHKPIVVGTEAGNIRFETVGLTNEEMEFQEYSKWLLQKIMSIYKMQPIVLGVIDQNMGKLNSAEQVKLFKSYAIKPILSLYAEKLNQKVIFSDKVMGLKNVYIDFDLDLVDKYDQARWHEVYIRHGILTVNEIRTRGLGLSPVPWGNVPYLQNNVTPFGQDGSALPSNPEEQLYQAPQETTQTPSGISSKSQIRDVIESGKTPVGWENLDLNKRLEVVERLMKEREKYLSKAFSIPNKTKLEE